MTNAVLLIEIPL